MIHLYGYAHARDDGEDATRAIRRLTEPVRSIPIMALPANAMTNEIERRRAAEMDDQVSKSIDRQRLRHALAVAQAQEI